MDLSGLLGAAGRSGCDRRGGSGRSSEVCKDEFQNFALGHFWQEMITCVFSVFVESSPVKSVSRAYGFE